MDTDTLATYLFIDDSQSDAVLARQKTKLESYRREVERMPNPVLSGTSFAGSYSSQLEAATRRQTAFIANQKEFAKGFDADRIALAATAIGLSTTAAITFGVKTVEANREAFNSQAQLKAIVIETGQSYEKLTKQAEIFGDRTLLSNRAAESTFAQLANFANAANRTDKLDEFSRRFTDLAAAKGINASQLGDISRQLNALTDEATDKLLNANPSAFYDKFAASIKKTADQLTDAEKRAAIFDEVLRKGALFDGFAEKRINDATSATDRLSRSFENFKVSVGSALVPLTDFVARGGQIDPKLFRSDAEREEVFRQQKREAEQRARETAEALRASDAEINAARLNPLASARNFALSNVNVAAGFNDLAARNKAIEAAVADANRFISEVRKRLEGASFASGGNVQFLRIAQREFNQFQQLFDSETRDKIRRSLSDAISNGAAAGFNKVLADSKTTLPELRKAIADISNNADISGDTKASLVSQFSARIESEVEKGKTKVRELGKTYESVFEGLAARTNADNPFVRLFSDAERSMKSLREGTKGLSADLIASFEQLERQQNARNLFSLRLDNQLNASDLQASANSFRNPFNSNQVQKQQSEFIDRFLFNNPNFLFLQGKAELDDATRSDILRRGNFDSIEKRRNDDLERQRNLLFNPNLSADQQAIADRKFIGLTSGLNPLELTESLRESAALAREREADRLLKAESEAKVQREKGLEIQVQIRDEIKKLNSIAEKEGLNGVESLIRIVDETGGKVRIAKTPDQSDTDNFMRQ